MNKFQLKITIDEINERSVPYQLFLDSIKSKETLRKYKKDLQSFLKIIPVKLYKDHLEKAPRNKEPSTLANIFVELSKKDPELAANVIATFIKNEKKVVDAGKLSANTLPNHIKPIKVLLDANRIPVHWKSLNKLLPRRETSSNDRAYTKMELQKMMQVAPDITDKLIIQLFSSGGFRLESWNYFTWKDYIPFKNKDGSYRGGSLLVYRGDPESYWTFVTPEACSTLELYREKWKADIGAYPKPDDPLIRAVKYPMIHRLNSKGVRKRVEKIVTEIGLRPPLPPGKNRHEVQLDHGFRKYFNTMMRRAKVNFLDKEDMMGHKVGLERHYERYQEEDFERFPEYQKAIPFLTISNEELLRLENQQKQEEINQLETKSHEIDDLRKRIEELEYGPEKRNLVFFKGIDNPDMSAVEKILRPLVHLVIEKKYSEEEKREMFKKMSEAKKTGKALKLAELLPGKF